MVSDVTSAEQRSFRAYANMGRGIGVFGVPQRVGFFVVKATILDICDKGEGIG